MLPDNKDKITTIMTTQEQEQTQQKIFGQIAAVLMDRKLTPEKACSMIGELRDAKIFPNDILDPQNREEEQQKGFNEIAGVFADWKFTTEEACELFEEWINEWK